MLLRWLGAVEDRVKALSCLGRLRELAMGEDFSVLEILEASLPIIRSGPRWPDLVQVHIEFDGKVVATPGWADSPWRQAVPLARGGAEVGRVEVAYPDPLPEQDPFLPEEGELLVDIAHRLSQLAELREARDELLRLHAVLRAIRNVDHLIIQEKDRGRLVQSTCERPVEARGYCSAWIALWEDGGRLVAIAEASLGDDFRPLIEQLERGERPRCVEVALEAGEPVLIEDTFSTCSGCPLAAWYGEGEVIAVGLRPSEGVSGVLTVSTPGGGAGNRERALLGEVSTDIAFALRLLELDEDRRRSEEGLRLQRA